MEYSIYKRKSLSLDLSKCENSEYIVETAQFVPMSVKFKRFVENGIMSRLRAEQYDTDLPVNELEKAFSMSEFNVNDDDDIFIATDKIKARNAYIEELKKSYSGGASAQKKAESDNGNNSVSQSSESSATSDLEVDKPKSSEE